MKGAKLGSCWLWRWWSWSWPRRSSCPIVAGAVARVGGDGSTAAVCQSGHACGGSAGRRHVSERVSRAAEGR